MVGSINIRPGFIIRGKWYNKEFKVIAPIGCGGTASIYLAKDCSTGEKYAVKLSKDMAGIDREYRILSGLSTVYYIPRVYCRDDCMIEGQYCYFFVMSYFNGKNLKTIFGAGKAPVKAAITTVAIAGNIFKLLNQRNLYYCDIKPENLIFDNRTGSVCIIDFGSIVGRGEAVTQYTPAFDRASWGKGARVADEGYQVFALLMMLLDFLTGGLRDGSKDLGRLKNRVNKSQLSKYLKKVIIKGLEQDSPTLERLLGDLERVAGTAVTGRHDTQQSMDIIINTGLFVSAVIFAAVLAVIF